MDSKRKKKNLDQEVDPSLLRRRKEKVKEVHQREARQREVLLREALPREVHLRIKRKLIKEILALEKARKDRIRKMKRKDPETLGLQAQERK